MGDLSSAIAHLHKALMYTECRPSRLNYQAEWERELSQLYFLKGIAMIDSGDTADALDYIKGLKIEEFKFIYLR